MENMGSTFQSHEGKLYVTTYSNFVRYCGTNPPSPDWHRSLLWTFQLSFQRNLHNPHTVNINGQLCNYETSRKYSSSQFTLLTENGNSVPPADFQNIPGVLPSRCCQHCVGLGKRNPSLSNENRKNRHPCIYWYVVRFKNYNFIQGTSSAADAIQTNHPKPHRLRNVLGLEAKNIAVILADADLDVATRECITGSLR